MPHRRLMIPSALVRYRWRFSQAHWCYNDKTTESISFILRRAVLITLKKKYKLSPIPYYHRRFLWLFSKKIINDFSPFKTLTFPLFKSYLLFFTSFPISSTFLYPALHGSFWEILVPLKKGRKTKLCKLSYLYLY